MSDPKRKSRWAEIADLPDSEFVGAVEADSPAPSTRTRWADIANEPDEAFAPAQASHVIEMPVQQIEGDARPWYQKLADAQFPDTDINGDTNLVSRKGIEFLGDAASGLASGMTARLDEKLPFGAGDAIKADREAALARRPGVVNGADALGMLAAPTPFKGSGLLGGAAAGAANAGGYAATRDFAASSDEDPKARALHAFQAAELPAAIGGAGTLVAGAVGKGLDRASVTARRFGMGGTPKQYGEIVDEQGTRGGIDYLRRDLGRIPEEQGLTNVLIPQSKATLASKAAARTEDVLGPQIGESLRQAESEIPAGAIERARIETPIIARANALEGKARPGWQESDSALRQAQVAPLRTPTDIAKLKREYEAEAYAKGAVGGSQESRYAQAQNQAAQATRDHLREVMDQADPATNASFNQANADYGDTKLVENLARRGAVMSMAAPAAIGAGMGGAVGYQARHDLRDTAGGAMVGAAAGAVARDYAPDLAANLLRLGERGATASAEAMPWFAKLAALRDDQERRRREAEGR